MARSGPAGFFLLVDGYNLTPSKLQSFTHKVINPIINEHGMGDDWVERSPLGVRDVEISQSGAFFDPATGAAHDALKDIPTAADSDARILCAAFAGKAQGDLFTGSEGVYSHEYEVLGTVQDLQRANPTYSVSGSIEEGLILQILEERMGTAANWSTVGVDNGAASDKR